jgi:hypothetical protein
MVSNLWTVVNQQSLTLWVSRRVAGCLGCMREASDSSCVKVSTMLLQPCAQWQYSRYLQHVDDAVLCWRNWSTWCIFPWGPHGAGNCTSRIFASTIGQVSWIIFKKRQEFDYRSLALFPIRDSLWTLPFHPDSFQVQDVLHVCCRIRRHTPDTFVVDNGRFCGQQRSTFARLVGNFVYVRTFQHLRSTRIWTSNCHWTGLIHPLDQRGRGRAEKNVAKALKNKCQL